MILVVGCNGSGGNATPTRTPRAVAQGDATQTPYIIYVPVTTTPEPATATAFPTVTVSGPTRTATRPPATLGPTRPPTARPPAASPTATQSAAPAAPTNTPVPSCGQVLSVSRLTFPENGATRTTREKPSPNQTVEFKWDPAVAYELDPKIGYEILVTSFSGNSTTQTNGAVLYVSHNGYLKLGKAILQQNAVYGLSQGNDVNVRWSVRVIMLQNGGFDDRDFAVQGTFVPCGPASPAATFLLAVT